MRARAGGARLRRGSRPRRRRGAGRRAALDPAGDARHDARRRDRPGGHGNRDSVLHGARGARAALPPGVRDRARNAPVARVDAHGPAAAPVTASTRTRASCPATARWSRSGCARRATARRPSCRASCSRAALASRAASSSTTTSCPPGAAERTAAETTARALEYLAREAKQPLLLWVHYYDPHHPYSPPEPFRTRYAKSPYLGEVAAMDAELGRLDAGLRAPRRRAGRDPDRGRSRRGPRRARRGAARAAALPGDDARPAAARGPGRRPGRERRAGQHAPRLPHARSTGRGSEPRTACARRRTRSCSARR